MRTTAQGDGCPTLLTDFSWKDTLQDEQFSPQVRRNPETGVVWGRGVTPFDSTRAVPVGPTPGHSRQIPPTCSNQADPGFALFDLREIYQRRSDHLGVER